MVSDTANVALKARMIALGVYDYKRHAPTRSRRPEVKYLYHASIKRIVPKVNIPPSSYSK